MTQRNITKSAVLAMGFAGSPYPAEVDAYKAFVDIYRQRHPELRIMILVGYNPQLLLTDQRPALKRLFDGGGFVDLESYSFDDFKRRAPEIVFPVGKLIYRDQLPQRERSYLWPRTFNYMSHVDIADTMTKFREHYEKLSKDMARFQDQILSHVMTLGKWPDDPFPNPLRKRDARILRLCRSDDPRKNKRGRRLYQREIERRTDFYRKD